MNDHVPAAPLVELVESTGGIAAATDRAGMAPADSQTHRRAYLRAKVDGFLTAYAADRIACEVLRLHPVLIWGAAWWPRDPGAAA